MTAIVSPVIDMLSRKHPRMSFHIVAGDTATLYRDVAERNIDLAICRMIGALPDELSAEILFHDSVAVMTTANNPLTRRRNLTLAELMTEPWVLFPYESFFGGVIADIFRANGHEPPRLTVSTLSVHAQNELLATGRFLTVLPSFMLRVGSQHLRLKALPVALPNASMPIGLMTVKNRTLTPTTQLFIDNVRVRVKALMKAKTN
jgi:DNA-binding transcriptional LysR family regulator